MRLLQRGSDKGSITNLAPPSTTAEIAVTTTFAHVERQKELHRPSEESSVQGVVTLKGTSYESISESIICPTDCNYVETCTRRSSGVVWRRQMEPMVPTASKDTQGQEKQRAGQGKKGRRGLTLHTTLCRWILLQHLPPSTGSDQQARAFMDAFIQYSKGQDLPDVLQAFLKKDNKDTKEDLRQQQRHLNLHRNVLQKIEAKKRAIKKDEDQWQNWVKEVKETIKTQKTKH